MSVIFVSMSFTIVKQGGRTSKYHSSQRESVDLGKGFAIHLPSEQYFVDLDLAPRHTDHIVIHLTLLEIRVCAIEFEMNTFSSVFEASAVFDDLLEGDTGPACCANGTFTPGCVDQFVSVAGVFGDLLNAASARALQTDHICLTGEQVFVLKISESKLFGVVNQAFDVQCELLGVDLGNTAVIADEMVLIVCDFRLDQAFTGWLSVVRELKDMNHVFAFLLFDIFPADVWNVLQGGSHGIVVLLPAYSFQDWVGFRKRFQLELWRWWESIFGQDLLCLLSLFWVFL